MRIEQERLEGELLSVFAAKSQETRGRETPILPCEIRTEYQRDRDRILHSKSFRRLKHKTQCFIAPGDDHFRTRLTHTLEVSQIARTISRALRLNEDLTEAIALGHDLGHTPFGHLGESTLNRLSKDGFKHNEQSLRMVTVLENSGDGLNLTWEVRDGILNHTGDVEPATCEGQVVRLSDRIAYINHDIDDAIRAGLLTEDALPGDAIAVLGHGHGARIEAMIKATLRRSANSPLVRMDEKCWEATLRLRRFLFDRIYYREEAKEEERRADGILTGLYMDFAEHPWLLPREYCENPSIGGGDRAICDYIACMTDTFAISCWKKRFLPTPFWGERFSLTDKNMTSSGNTAGNGDWVAN